jgi:hypothetical protein
MNTRKVWAALLLVAGIAFILQLASIASAQDYDDQSYDPPGRVGRLNLIDGSVSFRPAGEDDWVGAIVNRPIVTGDDLWADVDSRAEVHIGSAAVRLGEKTGITFLEVDDRTTQIRLAQGSLIVRVRHVDDDDSYEIDTPNLAFNVLQPGEYRIDVSEDGSQTIATVFHGRGRITGGGYTYTAIAGQSYQFTGDQQNLNYDLGQIPPDDGLDAWAADRDDNEDQADSANYVSREMTGYEDLDGYGNWTYVAGYGEVWAPTGVTVGWVPYRYGNWVYISPWGWTWVESEPWGYAPFHYGRWAFVNNGWFWVPGPVVVHPVWSPAMVAFVGGGPGFHFSAGVGVGWFPLAPGEVWVPSYHVSRTYVNNVNITNTRVNVTNVTNVYNTVIVNKSTTTNITYVNQRVNNSVTVVSHDAFVNARPVAQNVMRVSPQEIASAPVSHVVAAEPVHTSVVGAGRPVAAKPPAAVMSRPVVAVRTPPAPPPSIAQRQAQAGGHLNQQAIVHPMAPARPAPSNAPNAGQNRPQPQQQNGGFRPFTPPNGNQPNNSGNNQVHQMPQSQPRTYEQQGSSGTDDRNGQIQGGRNQSPQNRDYRQPPQPERPAEQSHPLVKPAPPVQERTPQQEQQQEQKFNQWHQQQKSAPPPPPKQQSKPASSSPPPKKQ